MRTIIRNDYDPKVGDYHDRIIIDESRKKKWMFDCDGVFTDFVGGDSIEIAESFGDSSDTALSQKFLTEQFTSVFDNLADEETERISADVTLQNQIDELKNSPDVVDIVDTKADLDAYDTSKLGENDIIRVLVDETQEDKSSYYRWEGGAWVLIGTIEQGGAKAVELTQAEYDALSDEEKMNGTIYFITDGQSSGGSGQLEADLTVSNPIGRYAMGEVIPEGTEFENIFRGILSQTYYPTYTAPSVTFEYPSGVREVGATISAATVVENFNPGAIMLQGTKQADRAGAVIEYRLESNGADSDFQQYNNTGSFNVGAITRTTKGNVTVTATVAHAAGPQPKDSDGNDYDSPLPAGTVSQTKTLEFILPFYWGASDTSTIADFTGLTKDVSKKGQKVYTYSLNNQHMVIAYDASYGNLTSILDPNNFETKDSWNQSTLTVGGNQFKVYVSQTAPTNPSAKYTFKF